jgi:hypothetical protein
VQQHPHFIIISPSRFAVITWPKTSNFYVILLLKWLEYINSIINMLFGILFFNTLDSSFVNLLLFMVPILFLYSFNVFNTHSFSNLFHPWLSIFNISCFTSINPGVLSFYIFIIFPFLSIDLYMGIKIYLRVYVLM